jgi:hypothetical protein
MRVVINDCIYVWSERLKDGEAEVVYLIKIPVDIVIYGKS